MKPFLKWVGGKTQIIDKLICEFPSEINNYREIFLGGGSVLFSVLTNDNIKINGKVYAYDLNEALIHVYKNIQSNYEQLYNQIETMIKEFNECKTETVNRKPKNKTEAMQNKENYYYYIRDYM